MNPHTAENDLEPVTNMRILHYPHDRLREACQPVLNFGMGLRLLVSKMHEALKAEDGLGLAAPQVGVPARLFITNTDQLRVFVNPKITGRKGITESVEGCLSFPGLRATVRRSKRVRISAQGLDGKRFKYWIGGLLAIVVQHELDHLDGVLMIDRDVNKNTKAAE